MKIVHKKYPGVDYLGRHDEIDNLTRLTQNIEGPLVIALNGSWGTGKTTFINLWRRHLEAAGKTGGPIKNLYFNAWESDYVDDPLVPLMAEFNKLAGNVKDTSHWDDAVKRALPKLAKGSVKAFVKWLTYNLLDTDKITEKIAAEAAGDGSKDLIDSFYEQEKAADYVTTALKNLVESSKEDQKNLIVFVDELDRCRPTYAIEVLERIKHLFSVENTVFVLSVDKEQLCHSISAVYGAEFDGNAYLQRFIDIDFKLKDPGWGLQDYIDRTIDDMPFAESLKSGSDWEACKKNIVHSLDYLCSIYDFSLRQINQLLSRLLLVACTLKDGEARALGLVSVALVIREKLPLLYLGLISEPSRNVEKIISEMEARKQKMRRYSQGKILVYVNLLSLLKSGNSKAFDSYTSNLERIMSTTDPAQEEYQYLSTLVYKLKNLPASSSHESKVKQLEERVELAQQMEFVSSNANSEEFA